MKHLLSIFVAATLWSLAFPALAAVPPEMKVQKASFAAQEELQVKTQLEVPAAPGPTAPGKSRQIASEKNLPSLEKRQQQLIDQEIQYWKFKNN